MPHPRNGMRLKISSLIPFFILSFFAQSYFANASTEMTAKYDSVQGDAVLIMNPDLPDFYGEAYHILMGMLSSPQLRIFIPGFSDQVVSEDNNRPSFAKKRMISFFDFFGFNDRIYTNTNSVPENPPYFEPIRELEGHGIGQPKSLPIRTNFGHTTHFLVKAILANSVDINSLQTQVISSLKQNIRSNEHQLVHRFIEKNIIPYLNDRKKGFIVWNRQSSYSNSRNMSEHLLVELIQIEVLRGFHVFIMGHALPSNFLFVRQLTSNGNVTDLTEHWKIPPFADSHDTMILQLSLFADLMDRQLISGQIGMLGGVMDGPAVLLGLPTTELTTEDIQKFPRMLQLQEAVSNLSIWHLNRISAFKCASALAFKPVTID